MYLDLLTNASLLDPSVWANQDVLASVMDIEAARKKRKGIGIGGILAGLCCLVVVAAIVVVVWMAVRKKKQQPPNQPPPQQY